MGVRKPNIMVFNINIEWIAEDKAYLATSGDIKGLVVGAESLSEMMENLTELVPILLEENHGITLDGDDDHELKLSTNLPAGVLLGNASAA